VTGRRLVTLGAATTYLVATLWVSYAVWGPYDGVEYEPAWAGELELGVALVLLHALVGALVGRWWALALPLAWIVLSLGAEGYDTPVPVLIAFTTPFYWAPAIAVGVAARKTGERIRRS